MKKVHPAMQLVNAVIQWYSKPRRYVKRGVNVFEDKQGNELYININNGISKEEIPNICRACLLGSMDLQADILGITNLDHKYRVKSHLYDLPEFKGFSAKYTTPQAKNLFIKVKKALQKELR